MKVPAMNPRPVTCHIALFVLIALTAFSTSLAADSTPGLIPNPDFRDEDGDGLIEGWEVKTFILEKDRRDPTKQRLSLKVKQESDRQITGELTTTFQGTPGFYQITIRYLDESDGISLAKLLVNGKVVHMWDFDNIFFDYFRNEIVDNVPLKSGDRLTIWAANDFTEYCRFDSIHIVPSPRPPSAREIEEMTPPAVVTAAFGDIAPLRDLRDMSAEEVRSEPRIKTSRASMLFSAREGETVIMDLVPNNVRNTTIDQGVLTFLGRSATGFGTGETVSTGSGVFFDPETGSGRTSFAIPYTGLYRFDIRNATPSMDRPHVFPASPDSKATSLWASGDFYCFVPTGTKAFAVSAAALGGRSSEILVIDQHGVLVKRTTLDPGEELAIRVPEGRDDAVWLVSVRGINPALKLRGIPPYLATQPEYLLVPRECVPTLKP
jgi:hypothetical protein